MFALVTLRNLRDTFAESAGFTVVTSGSVISFRVKKSIASLASEKRSFTRLYSAMASAGFPRLWKTCPMM